MSSYVLYLQQGLARSKGYMCVHHMYGSLPSPHHQLCFVSLWCCGPQPVLTPATMAGIRLLENVYKGGFPGHSQFGRIQRMVLYEATKLSAFTQCGCCISQCQLAALTNIPKVSPAKHNKCLWARSCYSTRWLRSGEGGAPEINQDPSSILWLCLPLALWEHPLTDRGQKL